ncbi:MAG TPA: PEP/pyruvate-binding domain-containing protein [Kofleriaceae bacterium]|nr:PEP/pyruvate-binding domain-containing protein [Kofleriaceae bacterium]
MFTPKIGDAETFEAFSKELGNERFAKLVLDLKTDATYYFDVSVYPMHKDFVFAELYKKPRTPAAVRIFDRNYGAKKTDFMMVYLVHHLQQDLWTFAFWDGDLATEEHVRRAYRRIGETFFLGDKVRFRPDSNYQEAVARRTPDVPHVQNDEIYKSAEYQPFNKGTAVGTLRVIPKGVPEEQLTFAPDEIVVLAGTISDITPVAGIVSETFSSPLSHLSLRAKGWRIPNIGLRRASEKLAALAGKVVYLEAGDVSPVIRAATDAEIAAARARRETKQRVAIPIPDLSATELRPLEQLGAADFRTVGPKAANLGIIHRAQLAGVSVPAGFGVPFHYYDAHVRAAGADKLIAALLADPAIKASAELRKQRLAAVRKAITDARPDPGLCKQLEAALAALPEDRGVFVRSSTNAEDLDDFSGAGLHETVPNVRGAAAVCDALRVVWASAWRLGAYDAREHAGIDQRAVAAAVLVQTAVDATAAGVLATVHPTDPTDDRNYTINAKSGLGIAVVDGRKVPESLIVSWYNRGIRVLSRSDEETRLVYDEQGGVREVPNEHRGKPVLTNRMAVDLALAGKQLTRLFKNDRLDVEWVYAGAQLYIVQTRPLVGS